MSALEGDGSPLFVNEQISFVEEKSKYRGKLSRSVEAALPASFDYTRSTRDNYICDDCEHVGKFRAIRSRLDASYHGIYCVERQALQDTLIDDATRHVKGGQSRPWIIFTAGAMGAGKSHAFSWMAERGIVPLDVMQIIDPDVFKAALPEWEGYLERAPLDAGQHTRRESGMLTEIALEVALRDRKHVWVDGSLRDGPWFRAEFERIRRERADYHIGIVHVVAEREAVYRRVAERAKVTGRHVPPAEIEDSLARVPASIELLAPLTDFLAVVENSGATPTLVDYCDTEACHILPEGCDAWSELTSRLCSDESIEGASPEPLLWTCIERNFANDVAGEFLTQVRG